MTRSLRRLAVTAAAVAVLATACGSSGSSSSDTAAASNDRLYGTAGDSTTAAGGAGTTAAGAGAPAPAAGDGAVTIKDFAFDPGDLTVAVGTKVTWTNDDSTTHRIKSGDGSFNSDDLKNGDTFEHTFDTAGTFAYICGIHPSMKGTITVTG